MTDGLLDSLRLGWVVLAAAAAPPSSASLSTRKLDEPAGSGSVMAIDADGITHLLFPVERSGPEGEAGAVRVQNRRLESGEETVLVVSVSCAASSLRGTFDHLLAAIIEALAANPTRHPGAVAVETLEEWRSLITSAKPALGPAALAGLLAELLVLREIATLDPNVALESWRGPAKARHDFRRGGAAIEVKSTLAHSGRRTTIHGVDQLEPPTSGSLYLAWHRFEVVPEGGLSLISVVDDLVDLGVSAIRLHRLLDECGSPPSLRETHDAIRFELRARQQFLVDDGFPRIVPASFLAGRMPAGVDDLTYRVELPDPDEAMDATAWESVVRALATAS